VSGTVPEGPGADPDQQADEPYRARRGEYRVRYRIDEDRHEELVMHIDHRRDACRT